MSVSYFKTLLVDRTSNKRVYFAVLVEMVLSIDERVDDESILQWKVKSKRALGTVVYVYLSNIEECSPFRGKNNDPSNTRSSRRSSMKAIM